MLRSKLTRALAGAGAGTEAINAITIAINETTGTAGLSLSGLTFESGDQLLLFTYDESSSAAVIETPSGWTLLDTQGSASGRGHTFGKVSDGTETSVTLANLAVTSNEEIGRPSVVIVVAVSSAYTFYSYGPLFNTASNMQWLNINSFVLGDISLAFGAYGDIVSPLPPALGYTLLAQVQNGPANDGCTAMVCFRDDVSGSVGPQSNDGGLQDEYYSVHVRLTA